MTEQKHFKQRVRARMQRTGESYTTARRHILGDAGPASSTSTHHFPGSTPAPTALRALLSGAGTLAPHTNEPFSEAMVFGISGGIGAGVFAFHYAEEDFSSFFIAGRHLWQDTTTWVENAAARFGVRPIVRETSGAKAAGKNLRDLLSGGGPVMVWLTFRGRQYHVATVHSIDDAREVAMVGDLGDALIEVPLADLATARAANRKDKNRALALDPAQDTPPLEALVRDGIAACVTSLTTAKQKNFRLDTFKDWANKLDGGTGPDSWEKMFRPGRHMYVGLRSVCDYIEHYDTGGGLSRPLFAEFLAEAGGALDHRTLTSLAEQYAELGRGWAALADAALPDVVPAFRRAKELLQQRTEAMMNATAPADSTMDLCARAMADAEAAVKDGFPLTHAGARALRKDLKARVLTLYDGEVAALEALKAAV